MLCAWQRYSPTLHISPHSHAHTYANADWKAIVYGDQFDSTLRVGVRNNKAAAEVAEYALIKEDLDGVLDLLSKERLPAVPTIDAGQAAGKSVVTAATSETAPLATSTPTPADINTPIEEALSNMAEDTRAQWEAAAARLARQYTKVVVCPANLAALVPEVQSSCLGKANGDLTGLVIFHFDVKLSGEAITTPHLRIPPFQDKFYEKLVSTILEARWHGNSDQKPSLNVGEVALLLDGGRHGTPNTYT